MTSQAAYERYENLLRTMACRPERAPFCLDLVLLGMGRTDTRLAVSGNAGDVRAGAVGRA